MNDLNNDALIFAGFVLGAVLIPVVWALLRLFFIEVKEGEAVLVVRVGKLAKTVDRPGFHWLVDRALPWVEVTRMSLKRDYRQFSNIVAHDSRGTTVIVDLWLEVCVVDPARARFAVDDWDVALEQIVVHSTTAILASRTFDEILGDRSELLGRLQTEITDETARWGISVDAVFLQRVSLLPEVAEQLFTRISAQLERQKADVEEAGHQRVAMLEAKTSKKVADLIAQAKGQYPAAVGRALGELRDTPRVFNAYQELYELSLMRPHRTIAFKGFKDGEVRSFDAAMFAGAGSPAPSADGLSAPRRVQPRGDAE
jgi:regulator of protease activity HflC (stomatin/prohibitin superfamily)